MEIGPDSQISNVSEQQEMGGGGLDTRTTLSVYSFGSLSDSSSGNREPDSQHQELLILMFLFFFKLKFDDVVSG